MATSSPDRGPRPPIKPVPWAYQVEAAPIAQRRPEPAPYRRRTRASAKLGDCLIYPLVDGPGVALLVVVPPFLWLMSIPVFDVIAVLAPRGHFNALALLIVPFTLPLDISFTLTLGYVLLFLGQVLVSSALGEDDHPRWPEWDSHRILDGLGRMIWAALVGLVVGGLPAVVYWIHCGDIDLFDQLVFAELLILGVGYAQMILAAALLHDSLSAAQPVPAVGAILRLGWRYLRPCLVSSVSLALSAGVLMMVLFRSPSLEVAALGLWGFWVLSLYLTMVSARVLGLTYFHNAEALGWFGARPKWASSSRTGRIYVNS